MRVSRSCVSNTLKLNELLIQDYEARDEPAGAQTPTPCFALVIPGDGTDDEDPAYGISITDRRSTF